MTTIALKRKDGGVSISRVHKDFITNKDIQEKTLKDIQKKFDEREKFTDWKEISEDDIPKDTTFRLAWGYDLKVDMKKAKKIHEQRLRLERNKLLQELDQRQYGEEHDELRKKLRDMPKNMKLNDIKTPEALKNFRPDVLDALK